MINLPYVNLPEQFTRLLSGQAQLSPAGNFGLDNYVNEHKELLIIIRRIFKDIDPDGFSGKIINVVGFAGIRNRLACAFLEKLMTGHYPEKVNTALINDIINIENKYRYFIPNASNRIFLLGFYAKMSLATIKSRLDAHGQTPLIIREEHIELMKYSKAKSEKLDFLILQIVHFEKYLGLERLETLLKNETRYEEIFSMLSKEEQAQFLRNIMTYASAIYETDIFLTDINNTAG